jgi:hypothetical protein
MKTCGCYGSTMWIFKIRATRRLHGPALTRTAQPGSQYGCCQAMVLVQLVPPVVTFGPNSERSC